MVRLKVTVPLEKIYDEPLPGEVVDVKPCRSCGENMTPWEQYFWPGRHARKTRWTIFIPAGVYVSRSGKFAAYAGCVIKRTADLISTGGGRGSENARRLFPDIRGRLPADARTEDVILREIGKGNVEQFEEMRRKMLGAGVNMRIPA